METQELTQFVSSPNGILTVGKPYIWKSLAYGDTAVHIVRFSPNEKVAVISIDGGEASRQAQHNPELSDGIYFVSVESGRLVKRESRKAPKAVTNTIREVAGVGKVAVVAAPPVARRPKRLSLKQALNVAFSTEETF